MDQKQWDQLSQLFERAAALSPADRHAFLDEVGATDPTLRHELEALLAADEGTGLTADFEALRVALLGSWLKASEFQPGQVVDHYRIIEPLGSGGMGIVYKARDTRLDRTVALKFLPPHASTDTTLKRRFFHEAKAASALDHPNICTIFEIGETAEGQLFITMPCYQGETLQQKIERGPLPIEEVLHYAVQMAEGLARAHEEGIVHRDIKPANVMVTGRGQVKLLDFGLAKAADQTQLTKEGATVGTVAYMSPEQARGEEVDFRTDIWSLGVVLYEMITGGRPFRSAYDQAVLYQILNAQAAPMTEVRPGIPTALDRIVHKALAKDPNERYQQIEQLINDLHPLQEQVEAMERLVADLPPTSASAKRTFPERKRYLYASAAALLIATAVAIYLRHDDSVDVSAVAPTVVDNAPRRLAVLPFANLRGDTEMDFLGFALADQIIGALAYVQHVLVRPSSSVRPYQGRLVDAETAGAQLRVDYVMTGNFLKEADVVRLNVELVEVGTNELIWREGIEVPYENTFQLQDIVAEKVLDHLNVALSREEASRLRPEVPGDPLAYEYYLRGLSYPLTNEESQLAIAMLDRSIALDSTYAPAYAELGFRLSHLALYAETYQEPERIEQAEGALLKALSLNGELLSALTQLAARYTERGKTTEAVNLLRRALVVNPQSASVHFYLGYVYRYAGCLEEARAEMELALALDPNNPRFRSIGHTYVYLNELEKAVEGYALDAESPFGQAAIGQTYLRMNRNDLASFHLAQAIQKEPEGVIALWARAQLAFLSGDPDQGVAAARQMERPGLVDGEQWYHIANVYGLLGNATDAARLLEHAVENGFFCYPFMQDDLYLDPVRADPLVQAVLREAQARHDAFEAQFCTGTP